MVVIEWLPYLQKNPLKCRHFFEIEILYYFVELALSIYHNNRKARTDKIFSHFKLFFLVIKCQ